MDIYSNYVVFIKTESQRWRAGTIWLACGTPDRQVTMKVEEDHGRDINLAIATNKAMQMFLEFLKSEHEETSETE